MGNILKHIFGVNNMTKRRKFTIILCSILCIILIIGICTAVNIWQYGNKDYKQKADVAIVLGAAVTDNEVSPVYRERINHAIWLYRSGYVDHIITTGGRSEDDSISEAEAARQYILQQGISEGVILIEDNSKITEENLKFSKEIMADNGWDSCIIVSDPLHMKRAMLMAKDFGMTAYSSPTPTTRYISLKTQLPFLVRETVLYLGYMILRPFR